MKKILCFSCCFILFLFAILPASAESNTAFSEIYPLISGIVPIHDITVKGGDPYPVAISIYLSSDDANTTRFGIYCYLFNEIFKTSLGTDFDLTVTILVNDGPRAYYTFTNSGTEYGELINYKQTNLPHHYENMTLEEFRKAFPAMTVFGCYPSISVYDLIYYNAIMDYVSSDWDTPEDTLLKQIAPQLGTTFAELKTKLLEIDAKILEAMKK